jgi:hypothetical protein
LELAYEILHGGLGGLVDAFHELQYVMSKGVYHSHANIIVIFMLQYDGQFNDWGRWMIGKY